MPDTSFTLAQLAQKLNVELKGDPDALVRRLLPIDQATAGDLTFLASPKFRRALKNTAATAVILSSDDLSDCPVNALVSDNPYLSYAQATKLFAQQPAIVPTIHPTAVIHPEACVSAGVSIGPYCVVEEGVSLAEGVILGASTVVGRNATIGARTHLHSHVSVSHEVKIGADTVIHANATIGCEGFGFAADGDQWQPITHLGSVSIGNRVRIGCSTNIDRGALSDTVIADNVIIDSHVQIAHNVRIGEGTAIAGCTAIAGSSVIGRHCRIGGASRIVDHVNVADRTTVTATTFIHQDVTEPGQSISSGVIMSPSKLWHRNMVRLNKLDATCKKFAERLTVIEKTS